MVQQDPFLTEEEQGNPGCGKGTPNACFALTLGKSGMQCSMISKPSLAQMAGIQLGWRVNVDPTDNLAWCPKGVLRNSKWPASTPQPP